VPADLKALLRSYPAEGMTAWRVGKAVGNVKNNDASLIEPVG
jgi:putative SOS response-associated peptidase YedK